MATTQTIYFILITLFNLSFAQQPNIVFIYVDDVGFNDFGFNKNTQTQTPFIDNLVNTESLLIDKNYVSFVCSPTRAQFLTGRYASHLGLQHNVFTENAPYSLTRQVSLLSNEFQSNGYSTHLIGKFHLGFQSWEYTPTYRGFDTFSGFYNGEETYFTHMAYVKDTDLIYYDLRENEAPDPDINNYSVYMQRDKFSTLLDNIQDNSNPFFIYLAFQAAHYPPQAPMEYSSLYCHSNDTVGIDIIKSKAPFKGDDDDANGAVYLSGDCTSHDLHMAQMTSIDDAMQVIVNKMKQLKLWDSTLMVFSSDNGAAMFSGDNAPLRGCKTTPFEGGVRVPGFITGGYLNVDRRGEILTGFPVHVTDWYPTLLSVAGIEIQYSRSRRLYAPDVDTEVMDTKWDYIEQNDIKIDIDGMDIWDAIQNNIITDELVNREILIHLDEIDCEYESCGAIIYGDWKYIRGPYVCDGSSKCGWNNNFMIDAEKNVLGCPVVGKGKNAYDWNELTCADGCLFNLSEDPCEMYDVKDVNADVIGVMEKKLLAWQVKSVMPLMGDDAIYLEEDEINPNVVCDSEYWCPYMDYEDVEFEQVLYNEYWRIYGNDVDRKNEDGDGFDGGFVVKVVGLFTVIGMCCVLYHRLWKRYEPDDVKEIQQESSPLL